MTRWKPVVATLALALLFATTLSAQQPGFKRTVIQKQDLSMAGREVVQAVAEIPAGMNAGRHTHPGEEVGYLIEGSLTLMVEGKPPVTVKPGESFFVPAGVVHDGKAEGSGVAKVLATYIVEKGKPLASPAQ
jgi:quercetin dioxygenase-like cupin family protein